MNSTMNDTTIPWPVAEIDEPLAFLDHPGWYFAAQMILSIVVLMARPTLKLLPYIMSLACASFSLPLYKNINITRDLGIGLEFSGRTLEDVMIKTSIFVAGHIGTLVFIEGYVLPHRDTFLGRLHAAYKMLFNGRRIGTTKLAPQMPLPDGHVQAIAAQTDNRTPEEQRLLHDDKKDDNYRGFDDSKEEQATKPASSSDASSQPEEPTAQIGKGFHDRLGYARRENRLPFIARRLSLVFVLYLIEYVLKPIILEHFLPRFPIFVVIRMGAFWTRLNAVTWKEIVLRTYLGAETAWSGYVFYTMLHSLASVFFVGIHLDEPHEWPPLFGDARQAYSIRRYWVKFYDRLIYRMCSEHGKFILRTFRLGGKGGSQDRPWQRWLLNLLIFTISAFMHAQANYWDGAACGYWDEVWWWYQNFLAIVAETAFQAALKRFAPRFYNWTMSNCVCKIVGFAWVYVFTIWTTTQIASAVTKCQYDMVNGI